MQQQNFNILILFMNLYKNRTHRIHFEKLVPLQLSDNMAVNEYHMESKSLSILLNAIINIII